MSTNHQAGRLVPLISAVLIIVHHSITFSAQSEAEEVVARVNGDLIYRSNYEQSRNLLKTEWQSQFPGAALKSKLSKQEKDLSASIEDQLLWQRAQAVSVWPDLETIKYLDQLRQHYNLADMEALEQMMVQQGVNPKEFQYNLRRQFLRSEVLQKEVYSLLENSVSKEEVDQFYRSHRQELQAKEGKLDNIENLGRQIREAIVKSKAQRAVGEYFAKLRKASVIEVKHGYQDTGATYTEDLNQNVLIAARIGDTAKLKAMLVKGANPNSQATQGYTALLHATEMGHKETLEVLLSSGADPNAKNNSGYTALMFAVMEGHNDIVPTLLAKGADANAKESTGGFTALIYAAREGQTDLVRLLLANHADANVTDHNDKTALIHATGEGRTPVVLALLEQGADPNARDDEGKTALIYAAGENRRDIMGALLEQKADVNARDNEGKTALTYAIEAENSPIVQTLLASDADVNAGDDVSGNTPLIYAASRGDKEIVRLLLKAGADVSSRNVAGETPLKVAAESGHTETIQLLREAGAKE